MHLPNSAASSNTPSTSADHQHPSSFLSQYSFFHFFYYPPFLNQHRLFKVVEEWVARLAVEVEAVSRAAGRMVHPAEVVAVSRVAGRIVHPAEVVAFSRAAGRMVHPAEVVVVIRGGDRMVHPGGTVEDIRVDIILGKMVLFRRELVAGKSKLFLSDFSFCVICIYVGTHSLFSTSCFLLSIYNLYPFLKAYYTLSSRPSPFFHPG